MAEPRTVTAYIDYKSPYAYLAKDLAYELERDFPVRVDWLPYVLDIPSFLGSARVDDSGQVLEEQRNPHQWRRVRYSYMDCRRQAQRRGLVIRGPQNLVHTRNCGMFPPTLNGPPGPHPPSASPSGALRERERKRIASLILSRHRCRRRNQKNRLGTTVRRTKI